MDKGLIGCGLVVLAILVVFALLIAIAIRTEADFKQRCESAGGHVLVMRRSSDLCVSEDGRIMENQ